MPPDQVHRIEEALEPEVAGHAMSLGGFQIVGMVGPSPIGGGGELPHIDFLRPTHSDSPHGDFAG